ncbi:MAG: DUF3848 domain-containing protein [Ruminococcus sp.]|nr:DUF3848 domain-containing protein [Ruminococcus sp.]
MKNKLLTKIYCEKKEYFAELMKLRSAEIIERAYETAWKEEIISFLEDNEFTDEEIELMLKCENLLNEMYASWLHTDGDYTETLGFAIKSKIGELKQ